jgi:hypothetical protein
MNIQMVPIIIIGLKIDLQRILHTLRLLGCVQIDPISEVSQISARPLMLDRQTLRAQEEKNFLLARIDGLLDSLKMYGDALSETRLSDEIYLSDYLLEAHHAVDTLAPLIQNLTARRESLETEQASLPRYEATLLKLLPIIPPEVNISSNRMVGVLVSRVHVGILDSVGRQALEITNGRAEVVANDIDSSTRAMLIVFPGEFADNI